VAGFPGRVGSHADSVTPSDFQTMTNHSLRAGWALVLALALASAGAQPSQNPSGGDPAVAAVQPASNLPAAATQAFPLAAYSACGWSLAQTGHFSQLGFNEAQFDAFLEGMRAAFKGKAYPMDAAAQQLAVEMGRRIGEIAASEKTQAAVWVPNQKGQTERYFKEMQRRLGLQIAGSGLGYNVQPGQNGIRPRPGDTIVLTCHATAADGLTKLPQLSCERLQVKMEGMLPGLMEGLQMMTVGSEAVFVLPPGLSFGSKPWPDGVERDSPLVYWITLHSVLAAGSQP
jgi:FKBP-type peptidyl-prolyl cis-trans isomerase FkpA